MNWFFSLIRIVGASLPWGSSLLQLQAEVDSRKTQKRLIALEDPLSALDPDVRDVSREVYAVITKTSSSRVDFPEEMYGRFRRVLAILEAHGFIKGSHAIGASYASGFWISNPSYLMYMCGLYEDPLKMDRLVQLVDTAGPGRWLNGTEISRDLELPLPAVRAIFQFYEARGFGILSAEIGTANYYSKV